LSAPPGGYAFFTPPPPDDEGRQCRLLWCPWWFVPLILLLVALVAIVSYECSRRRRRAALQAKEDALLDTAVFLEESERERTQTEIAIEAISEANPLMREDVENPLRVDMLRGESMLLSTANPLADSAGGSVGHLSGAQLSQELLAAPGWVQSTDADGNEFFIHNATGVTTYEMPAMFMRHRLSMQHDTTEQLARALVNMDALLDAETDAAASREELLLLRSELEADLETVRAGCVEMADAGLVKMETALVRAETNMARLEDIAADYCAVNGEAQAGQESNGSRGGKALWGVAADKMGAPGINKVSGAWHQILDHIRRVRENLKPVEQAVSGREDEDATAFIRSLRSRLRPVHRPSLVDVAAPQIRGSMSSQMSGAAAAARASVARSATGSIASTRASQAASTTPWEQL
jgi:hypothetical protein